MPIKIKNIVTILMIAAITSGAFLYALQLLPDMQNALLYMQRVLLSPSGSDQGDVTIVADGQQGTVSLQEIVVNEGGSGYGNQRFEINKGALKNQTVLGEDIVDSTITLSNLAFDPIVGGNSCVFDGKNILPGESVIAYEYSGSVDDNQCKYELRTCFDGKLTGTYSYSSCQPKNMVYCSPRVVSAFCKK